MSELLSRFGPGEFIGLVAVGGGLLVGLVSIVVGILGSCITSVRRRNIASTLVQDMLDRGVPTDEIVDVLLAMDIEDEDDPRLALTRHKGEVPEA